jgi:predicted component of type VI protein secretion system
MARSADAGRAARAQHEASQPAWLDEPSTGQRLVLPAESRKLTMGRDPDSDIRLDDPEVSRWHAVLLRTGSEWLIDDIGSTNGTYVNGVADHCAHYPPHRRHDGARERVSHLPPEGCKTRQ